jgi:hypothetical protein
MMIGPERQLPPPLEGWAIGVFEEGKVPIYVHEVDGDMAMISMCSTFGLMYGEMFPSPWREAMCTSRIERFQDSSAQDRELRAGLRSFVEAGISSLQAAFPGK